jgi:hypothetical protein
MRSVGACRCTDDGGGAVYFYFYFLNIFCLYVFLLKCALQVIVAVQMVVEEKFLTRYNVHALEAVGWEGKCSKVGSIL